MRRSFSFEGSRPAIDPRAPDALTDRAWLHDPIGYTTIG